MDKQSLAMHARFMALGTNESFGMKTLASDAIEFCEELERHNAELLEALQLALRLIQTPSPDWDEADAVVDSIRAAIAKATGETK